MEPHPSVPAPPGLLSTASSVLVVVAHPDDESFGLGALLGALADRGVPVAVLCFTHGEASTLRQGPDDLAAVRATELRQAADVLGVRHVELLDHPDGALTGVDLAVLAGHVATNIDRHHPSHLLVFDAGGVTGHADHIRATQAARAAAGDAGLPVVAWTIPSAVAERLNAEFGTAFAGLAPTEPHDTIPVTRDRQRRAIACHHSQATDNPVLHRRLELLGDVEWLCPVTPEPAGATARVPVDAATPRSGDQ